VFVACYINYNVAQFILASLLSIHRHVDRVVMVDGRFQDSPWSSLHSDDGTLEVLEAIRPKLACELEVHRPPRPWKHEMEARNYYLTLLDEGDIFFEIHDDEIVYGDLRHDLERFAAHGGRTGVINVVEIGALEQGQAGVRWEKHVRSRAYKFAEGMHYAKCHWHVYDREGRCLTSQTGFGFSSWLLHLTRFREPERQRLADEYQAHAERMRAMGVEGY